MEAWFDFTTHEVVVERLDAAGVDPMNNPIRQWVPETVGGVLVAPSAGLGMSMMNEEVGSANRPDGVKTTYVIYFPKTYNRPLRGARVWVPGEGEPLGVVGDPKPYDPANTPGDWNYVVYLETVKG